MPKFLIIIIAVIIAAVAASFWYFGGGKIPLADKGEGEGEKGTAIEVKDGLGAEALNKANNPLSNELPETNPFEVNTNPFKETLNPFNKVYRNPFK